MASAEKPLDTTPIDSATANPFTGPVPYSNSTSAVSNVVTFESKIAQKDLLKPAPIAPRGVFPARSSSRDALVDGGAVYETHESPCDVPCACSARHCFKVKGGALAAARPPPTWAQAGCRQST